MPKVYALRAPNADTPARPWKWHEPTGYVFFRPWETLAALPLSGQAFRLLCAVIAHTDWGNHCTGSLSTIGRTAALGRSTVARVLPQLITRQLVYVDRATDPRRPSVHLNPAYVWKGRPWHKRYAQAQFWAAWQLHHGPHAHGDSPHPAPRGGELPRGNHPEKFSHPFLQHEPATALSAVEAIEVVGVIDGEGMEEESG